NYYGKKISKSVEKGIEELKEIDSSLPDISFFREAFAFHGIYHQVAYIHGDLNPENVLVWENERRILICKLIDFGEVIPKKKENFTPLFWDFSRLLGEMILNFVEETTLSKNENNQLDSIEKFKEDFWDIIESFFQNNTTKLEKADLGLGFIARIYLSNLFDFINEAKSGIKDLRRMEVIQDYFYCQSLFFIFYSKFQKENPYKRLFGLKLAIKFLEYASSRANSITSIIESLEKFYFQFSRGYLPKQKKHKGPDVGARSPFKGLAYFEEKDQDLFFGREKVTEDLINAIEAKSIVALAGTSGSGKSSVVHAGVIPGLRKKGYIIFKFRPGSNPIQSAIQGLNRRTDKKNKNGDLKKEDDRRERESDLRTILRSILEDNKDKKVFLLGDQLEELFTLFNDEMEKKELGNSILDIANEFKDRFRFLITIRADFWGKLLEDPSFGSVVGDSGDKKDMGVRFFLSPMNTDELRSAIEEPLKKFNLQIQEELTDLMISSLSGQSGGLPLLQFCLEELWKRQEDYTLTYEAYKEIGEVKGALATYAEQIYKSLKKVEKDALKKIMVQLIQPGHGTEDTRRIALVSEVVSQNLIEIENEKSKKKKNKTEIDEEKENFNIKEFIEKLTN
ncbi:MAG: hypothetical protein KDK36_02185, partial [Leptospiraceae bacterium]|nr:hypothetical protein [Leptospiraceae bacterium]